MRRYSIPFPLYSSSHTVSWNLQSIQLSPRKILLVEPDPIQRDLLKEWLQEFENPVDCVVDMREAEFQSLATRAYALVLSEFFLPGQRGISILQNVKKCSPSTEVILMGRSHSSRIAMDAIRAGAVEYLSKPVRKNRLLRLCERILKESFCFGIHPAQTEALGIYHPTFEELTRATSTSKHILLIGEPGSEIESIARNIHQHSARRQSPFIPFLYRILPSEWIEIELFGCEKKWIPEILSSKLGKLDWAHKGSLFIEDFCRLPSTVQTGIMKTVERDYYYPLGGNQARPLHARLFVSMESPQVPNLLPSQESLLFFWRRLGLFSIRLPPLRERKGELLAISQHLLQQTAHLHHRIVRRISPPAQAHLLNYDWPGNLRELKATIEQAVLACFEEELKPNHLPPNLLEADLSLEKAISIPSDASLKQVERSWILHMMKKYRGNKTKVAAALGISRRALYHKLE